MALPKPNNKEEVSVKLNKKSQESLEKVSESVRKAGRNFKENSKEAAKEGAKQAAKNTVKKTQEVSKNAIKGTFDSLDSPLISAIGSAVTDGLGTAFKGFGRFVGLFKDKKNAENEEGKKTNQKLEKLNKNQSNQKGIFTEIFKVLQAMREDFRKLHKTTLEQVELEERQAEERRQAELMQLEAQREKARAQPRDEKGRFMKAGDTAVNASKIGDELGEIGDTLESGATFGLGALFTLIIGKLKNAISKLSLGKLFKGGLLGLGKKLGIVGVVVSVGEALIKGVDQFISSEKDSFLGRMIDALKTAVSSFIKSMSLGLLDEKNIRKGLDDAQTNLGQIFGDGDKDLIEGVKPGDTVKGKVGRGREVQGKVVKELTDSVQIRDAETGDLETIRRRNFEVVERALPKDIFKAPGEVFQQGADTSDKEPTTPPPSETPKPSGTPSSRPGSDAPTPSPPPSETPKPSDTSVPATPESSGGDRSSIQRADGLIDQASSEFGVEKDKLRKIATFESSMNPDAPPHAASGAAGLFQITSNTADLLKKKFPDKFDADASRLDPETNARMGAALIKDNDSILQSRIGRNPTAAESQFIHLFGAGTAATLLSQPNIPIKTILGRNSPAYQNNQNLIKGSTPEELLGTINDRFRRDMPPRSVASSDKPEVTPTTKPDSIASQQTVDKSSVVNATEAIKPLPIKEPSSAESTETTSSVVNATEAIKPLPIKEPSSAESTETTPVRVPNTSNTRKVAENQKARSENVVRVDDKRKPIEISVDGKIKPVGEPAETPEDGGKKDDKLGNSKEKSKKPLSITVPATPRKESSLDGSVLQRPSSQDSAASQVQQASVRDATNGGRAGSGSGAFVNAPTNVQNTNVSNKSETISGSPKSGSTESTFSALNRLNRVT